MVDPTGWDAFDAFGSIFQCLMVSLPPLWHHGFATSNVPGSSAMCCCGVTPRRPKGTWPQSCSSCRSRRRPGTKHPQMGVVYGSARHVLDQWYLCVWLVVWNIFFHNRWDNPSHWHIFFRGVQTTNKVYRCIICMYTYLIDSWNPPQSLPHCRCAGHHGGKAAAKRNGIVQSLCHCCWLYLSIFHYPIYGYFMLFLWGNDDLNHEKSWNFGVAYLFIDPHEPKWGWIKRQKTICLGWGCEHSQIPEMISGSLVEASPYSQPVDAPGGVSRGSHGFVFLM